MKVIAFHGVITETLLTGGGVPGWPSRTAGQGWYHHWLWCSTTVWMRVGTPCTYIVQPDIDWTQSNRQGKIIHCMRLTALPGHLAGVMAEEEAIVKVCDMHFRDIHQRDWLRQLTQSGRIAPQPQPNDVMPVCACSINTLMTIGCTCGAIVK